MALIVYNKENSRPQQVVYQGKRTINMDSKGTVYLSKTMSIELGILGGGRVNFAHDEDTGEWYICHTTDKDGFTVWKDKRCGWEVQYITRFCFPIRFSNSKKKVAQKDPLSDNGDGFFRLCCLYFYIILFGALGYGIVRTLHWHNTMS